MPTWFRHLRQALVSSRPARRISCHPLLEGLEQRCLLDGSMGFVQKALVSDIPGLAAHTDLAVINPWGFTETAHGQFLVSNNGSGNAAAFDADGNPLGAPIVIPPPAGSPAGTHSAPNGQVANHTGDFVISAGGHSAPASVLFSTED